MARPPVSLCAGFVLLGISALAPAAVGDPAVRSLELHGPRDFGYVIGDVFRHHLRVELNLPYRLEADSLPLAGRVSRWLEIRASALAIARAPGVTVYDITLDYQIFNAPAGSQRVSTPALELRVAGPEGGSGVVVPAWEFSLAPIIAVPAAEAAAPPSPRPPRAPPPIPLTEPVARLTLMATVFAATLLYLAWLRWGLALWARGKRPFARAYRDLKRLKRRPFDDFVYRQALRRLHGAFNETAGRALFCGQLEMFHASHPRFRGLESSIDALFVESRSVFFAGASARPPRSSDLTQLLGLCRECRERERRRG